MKQRLKKYQNIFMMIYIVIVATLSAWFFATKMPRECTPEKEHQQLSAQLS